MRQYELNHFVDEEKMGFIDWNPSSHANLHQCDGSRLAISPQQWLLI